MPSYTALAVLALALTAQASRVKVHHKSKSALTDNDECDVNSCSSFDEAEDCNCKQFEDVELVDRAANLMFDMVQNMRYLTDYQTTASFLSRLWNNAKVSGLFTASFDDLEFLMEAIQNVPELEAIANSAAKDLATSKFDLPAGAMPIMVEIWDEDLLSGEFLGEVGVPFLPGPQSYNMALRANPARSLTTFKMATAGQQLGNVSFSTNFSVDAAHPKPCPHDSSRSCAKASLSVTCNRATDLVDLDGYTQGMTDPYCKVRVKQDERFPSTKDATPAINDNLNPIWNDPVNTFNYAWEVELATPQEGETNGGKTDDVHEKAYVPWTLDHMTVLEQFISNTQFLIKETALGGKECSEVAEKNANQQTVCDLLESLEKSEVTDELIDEIAKEMPDSEVASVVAKVPVTKEAGDSLLQKEGEDSSSSPPHHHNYHRNRPRRPKRVVHHHHHYQPRPVHHNNRAYHHYRPNRRRVVVHHQCRGPHCKWVALTFLLFFILLIPIGL